MVDLLGTLFVSCSDQNYKEMFYGKSFTSIAGILCISMSSFPNPSIFWLVALIDLYIQKFIVILIASWKIQTYLLLMLTQFSIGSAKAFNVKKTFIC